MKTPARIPELPWPSPWDTWRRRFHPARSRLQRDPLARLHSLEEVVIAAELGIAINVNQATVDDWLRLPGISIRQAQTLTALSRSGVAFYCPEDIAAALDMPVERLSPFLPLLKFCYYDPASGLSRPQLSLNQAIPQHLMTLPGMSLSLLERIVNERRRSPFQDWSEVHHRLRLTPELTQQWMHYLHL